MGEREPKGSTLYPMMTMVVDADVHDGFYFVVTPADGPDDRAGRGLLHIIKNGSLAPAFIDGKELGGLTADRSVVTSGLLINTGRCLPWVLFSRRG